ncbi:MAG: hypothetical protein AAGA30_17325 [Planctomycetota bacterium]
MSFAIPVFGDELILDESLTSSRTLGDFNIATCMCPVEIAHEGLFDTNGEITAGQLYTLFKKQGLESVEELKLCLDLAPEGIRADYNLSAIELRIEDLSSTSEFQSFSLGDNQLLIPGYEASNIKPEAQISIKLDYDFMKQFNESSTEKISFNYSVDGETTSLPMTIGVLSEPNSYSPARAFFLVSFIGFWIVVFFVLFRVTSPRSENAVYSA